MAKRRISPQATTIVSVHDRPVAVRVRRLAVEVTRGPDAGARAELAGRVLRVGGDASNDLVLEDAEVSRFHCTFLADRAGFRVVDRSSANGTWLSGVRVRDAFVADGTTVDVGRSSLAVRLGEDEAEIELAQGDMFGALVGRSVAMRELFATARRAAASAATVLILGETGTGKDLLARAIHAASPRAQGPFVVVDCGAIAPTLMESALFGHVKGAFTGADADRPGLIEAAHGGTLFLDEVGELPLELQPKLLRAVDTGTVTRLGDTREIAVDCRFLAATNRDLRVEVDAERFRSDLFYRLAVIVLEVPPLRERAEDIPVLAAHFLRHLLLQGGTDAAWLDQHVDQAFGRLRRHRWPGNVRELRNVIERAAAMADPRELAVADGFSRLLTLRNTVERTLAHRPPLAEAREHFDREYLRDLLDEVGGNLRTAAEIAGVHPKSLSRLLRRYGIPRTA